MRNEKISSLSIPQNFFSAIYNRIKNLIPYIENTVYSQWNVKSKYFFKIIVILHFNPDVIFVEESHGMTNDQFIKQEGPKITRELSRWSIRHIRKFRSPLP